MADKTAEAGARKDEAVRERSESDTSTQDETQNDLTSSTTNHQLQANNSMNLQNPTRDGNESESYFRSHPLAPSNLRSLIPISGTGFRESDSADNINNDILQRDYGAHGPYAEHELRLDEYLGIVAAIRDVRATEPRVDTPVANVNGATASQRAAQGGLNGTDELHAENGEAEDENVEEVEQNEVEGEGKA